MERRKLRQTNKKKNTSTKNEREPRHRYNTRYNRRARIQKIQDALFAAVESDSNGSDDESYTSANTTTQSDNSQK